MKTTILSLFCLFLLTGCLATKQQPNYRYNYGYGRLNVPITDDSSIKIPFGKTRGKIAINSSYGNISF